MPWSVLDLLQVLPERHLSETVDGIVGADARHKLATVSGVDLAMHAADEAGAGEIPQSVGEQDGEGIEATIAFSLTM